LVGRKDELSALYQKKATVAFYIWHAAQMGRLQIPKQVLVCGIVDIWDNNGLAGKNAKYRT
jgi:hypothetical protein